jgi:hypothetical protein
MKNQTEKDLYPIVEKWLKKHFLCFKVDSNKGSRHSRPDVTGIRDIGGNLSGEVQTIAVEVKKEGGPFATMSGQTLGYSVYANRIYLAQAREEAFSINQLDIANHLGIGLIQIRGKACYEILSSPFYTPITRLNLELLEKLGLGRCQFCGSIFEMGKPGMVGKEAKYTDAYEAVPQAINEEKGLIFWSWKIAARKRKLGLITIPKGFTREWRFICPECVTNLLPVDPDRIISWIRAYSPKHAD